MSELEKYSKANPFKVPENYFDNFEEEIMKKIEPDEDQENRWKIKSIKPFLAIAAGFLIIMSMWFLLLSKFEKHDDLSVQTNSTQESIIGFFESVDSEELINILTSEEYMNQDYALNPEDDFEFILEQVEESDILEEI